MHKKVSMKQVELSIKEINGLNWTNEAKICLYYYKTYKVKFKEIWGYFNL